MSTWVALWCRCGTSMRAKSNPGSVAERIAGSFRDAHSAAGCEITDDQALGRKWRAAARRAEARSA